VASINFLGHNLSQVPVVNIRTQENDRIKGAFAMSTIRILVVEDFAPFREFIRSTLGERADLQVICEVGNGLEAVQKAEELKPDLILLDIGLPTLNGIEAARQIRKLAPESKIIFLTQESSDDMVEEALSLGAWGYVLKCRAASDLSAVVEAAILGVRFAGDHVRRTRRRFGARHAAKARISGRAADRRTGADPRRIHQMRGEP
jgi:DNA-binding NarL/FixJ family response regulator